MAAGRGPGEVERRRAAAPDVAHLRQQPRDDPALRRAHPGLVAEARRHQSGGEIVATVERRERHAVEGRRLARGDGEQLVAHRVEHHAGAPLAGDRHRPLRVAEEVVGGAVERVDDPAQARRARAVVALLSHDRVVGTPLGQQLADRRARPRCRPRTPCRSPRTSSAPRGRRSRSARAARRPPRARRRRRRRGGPRRSQHRPRRAPGRARSPAGPRAPAASRRRRGARRSARPSAGRRRRGRRAR